MFLEIPEVLTPQEVARLVELARAARFAEGGLSNPLSKVKNNLQIDVADPAHAESSKLMAAALQRNEAFRGFTFARIWALPWLARYEPGMNYGVHSDATFMPTGSRPLRSDLSCTLFIADPGTYEGGELAIHLGPRAVEFKLAAGAAVVYPSSTLHEVRPVTAGQRLVGLTFIESTVPDAGQRDLLWQLEEIAALEGVNMSWDNRTRLQYVRNNLRRMWAEAI
jgi:PKHD-type hydroxylase